MSIPCMLVAIFIVFISRVHCENAANINEGEIYIPSAPYDLTADNVLSNEIHLRWSPPKTFTIRQLKTATPIGNDRVTEKNELSYQNDEPVHDGYVVVELTTTTMVPAFIAPERTREIETPIFYRERDYYTNEKRKLNDKFSNSDVLRDRNLSKRDLRYVYRKRRHDPTPNATEAISEKPKTTVVVKTPEKPKAVVKKSQPQMNTTYILFYEQGKPLSDAPIEIIPTEMDIKRMNVFPSDLGIIDNSKDRAIRNLTLVNKSGFVPKVFGFRLVHLKSLTPYKIWVRAFYNYSAMDLSLDMYARLSPSSNPIYVLTDVLPPSAPAVVNLTCLEESDQLYLQWRQPNTFENSLDQYVVSLRKIPELQPRANYTLVTNKNIIETTMSMTAELRNSTSYEVKIFAGTLSVVKPNSLINGLESYPETISSDSCIAHSEAYLPPTRSEHSFFSALTVMAVLPTVVVLAILLAALYWRCRSRLSKCISAAYSYLEEGGERAVRVPLNSYKKPSSAPPSSPPAPSSPPHPRPPRISSAPHPALTAAEFVKHVAKHHRDSDHGFSKEYEIVVQRSAALSHTSHYSHRPENKLKNRYLNITAYDHSRVCVSSGGRCGAAGCVGNTAAPAKTPSCDYVNANFIDGMLPALDRQRIDYIKRKLEKRKVDRQPSVRPLNPSRLTSGIESAFLSIEFSGIVDAELDDGGDHDPDATVLIDGEQTNVKLEWLVWRHRYIATQGPTPATLAAFWLMIHQHRVNTVVMITNLVERGRRKCDMYWPGGARGSVANFGDIRVTLLEENVYAAYTVRQLLAQNTANPDEAPRVVRQFHYTLWPDHGTPRHPLAVLPFVRAAAARAHAPVLVHCSAGVGRTGTYIVLDAQLNQLKLTGTLSPLGFLCRARTQRNHLVQTEEQYIFVHDALLEHVRSGNTEIQFDKAREYLVKLLQPITEDELAVLDLNTSRNKSTNDLTNGYEHNETASIKSQVNDSKSDVKDEVLNGEGSISIKLDDLSDRSKSTSAMELNGDSGDPNDKSEVNGEENEGVYDLAPRSTDTYSKKMAAYNSMSEQEKEEVRKANRAENYAILERMRSLSSRSQPYFQGPPPVNILEKQFQLISQSCVEAGVCSMAAHNADKNRPGGVLPSDAARVLLLPKAGVEGSEYINASWVCGRHRVREYCVCQRPTENTAGDLWRLLWDHTAQLVLSLSAAEPEDDEIFWPTEDDKELYVANFKASFVSKEIYVAHRKSDRKPAPATPPEPEVTSNGYKRQESDCADDERLIPDNHSPVLDSEPAYRFDRTELRLERLSTGSRDLTSRKSIANGDLFSSFSEARKPGPKSPRSPSKMSLKNFKLGSPTKFKFPDWSSNSKGAGSPPEESPPPPPVPPTLTVEEEAELRRPVYYFEKVDEIPDDIPSDRIIEVTNVSVHSLQDDYQLNVKFINCCGWLESDTTTYKSGKPDDNDFIRAVREAVGPTATKEALDQLLEPFKDSCALVEFVNGCQMEYKNGPVVVVDKYGGSSALSFCTVASSVAGVRPTATDAASDRGDATDAASDRDDATDASPPCDVYCAWSLSAHARCRRDVQPYTVEALLNTYCAVVAYADAVSMLSPPPADDIELAR